MTGRRLTAAAIALVLVAVAAALAVLAVDVLRWGSQVEEADLRYQALRGDRKMWQADTVLPARFSRKVVGVDDDIAFREALQMFRLSGLRAEQATLGQVATKSGAELRLERIGRTHPDPRLRSQAANLRGVMSFEEARGTSEDPSLFLRRALADFKEAMRLDPENEAAKYNLELVLRLIETTEEGEGGGSAGARGDTPASGAGAATGGSGY